jgi:hypothetical protein
VTEALARATGLLLAGALVVAGTAGCGLRDRAAGRVDGSPVDAGGAVVTSSDPATGPSAAQVAAVEAALAAAEDTASAVERQLAADDRIG